MYSPFIYSLEIKLTEDYFCEYTFFLVKIKASEFTVEIQILRIQNFKY